MTTRPSDRAIAEAFRYMCNEPFPVPCNPNYVFDKIKMRAERIQREIDAKPVEGLLPCPFCGGVATSTNYVVEAAVRCDSCGAIVMRRHPPTTDDGLPKAIAAWNRREGRGDE